jgi:exodeoxyribonuclease VII large subunit
VDAPTFRVSELADALQIALDVCFPDEVWVQGEISSLKRAPAGHVYFQLVEPGPPGAPPIAQMAVTLFAKARAEVNASLRGGGGIRMTDGVEIRIRGRLGFYGPQGRVQLRMSAIDPTYTLGRLAGDRERLLQALAAEGLLDRNGQRALTARPVVVGLATSVGSAAEADFLHELSTSGLAWEVVVVDCRVQGAGAERSIVAGLRALAAHPVDVIALVRGGGARTDLATFDGALVARQIATTEVPVITGIGHEVDSSVADEVAHTACKTPTACAAHLVGRARAFHDRADQLWTEIVERARAGTDVESQRLSTHGRATARAAMTGVAAAEQRLSASGRRLVVGSDRATEHAALRLDSVEARVGALDPRRALDRGWSITRRSDGTLVRRSSELEPGTVLVTQLADGSVRSTVDVPAVDAPVVDAPTVDVPVVDAPTVDVPVGAAPGPPASSTPTDLRGGRQP